MFIIIHFTLCIMQLCLLLLFQILNYITVFYILSDEIIYIYTIKSHSTQLKLRCVLKVKKQIHKYGSPLMNLGWATV